jgi:hypothetical protein
MASRVFRWSSALAIAGGALMVTAHAYAESTITLSLPQPTRSSPNNDLKIREQSRNPNGVNFDDCIKDAVLTFPVAVAPLDGRDQLQVWAGTVDCTADENRKNTTGSCNPVTDRISLKQTLSVNVRAQDIAAHIGDSTTSISYQPAGASACTKQTAPSGTQLGLYFIPLTSDNRTDGTAANYSILVDTVGPPAPSRGDPIGLGDTLLNVKWTPATDSDTAGFRVFCDPRPGNEGIVVPAPDTGGEDSGVVDTGVADTGSELPICPDASVEDGGDASIDLDACVPFDPDSGAGAADTGVGPDSGPEPVCGSTVLKDGLNGSELGDDFICGDIADKAASEFKVDGLINGVDYTFAVAATDISENAGPMTVIGCETPQAVDDFWKKYRQAGGQAGGGFCALEGVGMPAGTSVFVLGMIGVAVAAIRRRRRS